MRMINSYTIVGSALVLLLSNAGFADDSLLTAEASKQEIQLGTYDPQASGSQTRVREYDGRDFNHLGIESFSMYGYKAGSQYWFDARDLVIGDESVSFGVSSRNFLRFRGGTDLLTHRLASAPAINPWVARQLAGITPAPAALALGVNRDTVKDLSPGAVYSVDRRVNELNLYVNADKNQRLGLTAGWWQEDERGQRQLLFRAREAEPGVINNRDRGSIAMPIDRETNEGMVGADIAIGKNSVVNVKYTDTKFGDQRVNTVAGSSSDFSPVNNITKIGTETVSRVIKARSAVNDKLQFTGVQINRERTNAGNDIPATYTGAGSILNKRLKTSFTNLGMVYRPTNTLSVTGRWQRLAQDNLVPPIFAGASTTPSNEQLSQSTQSAQIEGVYTGIPRAYMRFGLESRKLDRENSSLHPGEAEFLLPFTGESTDWTIKRAAVRYRPMTNLNISGNYENWNAGNSGFTGTPNNRTKTSVNATYMLRDNVAVYGDFSKWGESNNEIRVAGAIPNTATTEDEAELRALAAGQGLDTTFKTTSVGAWVGITDKLTLDANYGAVSTNSSTLWIIGYESAFAPHLPAQVVPFKSNNNQWSAGANYVLNPKMKFRGGFFHANSDGASYVDPAKFAQLGPEWTPFKVNQDRWSLGFEYGVSKRDRLQGDVSVGKWVDEIDSANTGRFQLFRLAWARQL